MSSNHNDFVVGKYPQIDYNSFKDRPDRVSWINHIIRVLEDEDRKVTSREISMTGIFQLSRSEDEDETIAIIRQRIPDLKIIRVGSKAYWTRDTKARERLAQMLISERRDFRNKAANNTEALKILRRESNMRNVLDALEGHGTHFLNEIANRLKQDFGGEGWAIGEMVHRAILQYEDEMGFIQIKNDQAEEGDQHGSVCL